MEIGECKKCHRKDAWLIAEAEMCEACFFKEIREDNKNNEQ